MLIPPKGYLEKVRAICTKHDILLIFDEVITGFGRMGTPFATDYFGVTPDLITVAKGINSGVIPMGACNDILFNIQLGDRSGHAAVLLEGSVPHPTILF